MSHIDYTISELAQDPSFRRMVKGIANEEEIERWNTWMEESEENRAKARSAISDIAGFEFDDPGFPDIEQKWSALHAKIVGKEKDLHPARSNLESLKWIFRAVAVLLVVSMVGLGTYYFYNDGKSVTHLEQLTGEATITTANGEQKTLTFSDGSRVVLNSNSTLTYRIGLLRNQTIDVTLEGEAWFDVVSNPSHTQPVFAVATPDGVIRDIGTKFLVTVHNGRSRVVLQEGLVEVAPVVGADSEGERFSVQKGELVEFSGGNILKRESVNPTFYTSWVTGFMQFDETGIREFAGYAEQRFGVKVQIEDPELSDITLDGAVYFKSLEGLVRSVSDVTGIPVYQSEDRKTVYIGTPNDTNR